MIVSSAIGVIIGLLGRKFKIIEEIIEASGTVFASSLVLLYIWWLITNGGIY